MYWELEIGRGKKPCHYHHHHTHTIIHSEIFDKRHYVKGQTSQLKVPFCTHSIQKITSERGHPQEAGVRPCTLHTLMSSVSLANSMVS